MEINNYEEERRKRELAEYGRLLSLRPSKIFKSKKDYKRVKVKITDCFD